MVVAIVERGTARQEIEIAAAAIVVHPHVGCLVELARYRPGIAADPRFAAFIDAPVRNRAGRLGCHGHGLSLFCLNLAVVERTDAGLIDRKSTRLNSSH